MLVKRASDLQVIRKVVRARLINFSAFVNITQRKWKRMRSRSRGMRNKKILLLLSSIPQPDFLLNVRIFQKVVCSSNSFFLKRILLTEV
jgi:hypothetical protein